MPEEIHISSLIVQGMPEALPTIRAAVAAMEGMEVHAEGAGKLVVTLETADEGAIMDRLTEIGLLDGVLSTALVFHQVDTAEVDAEVNAELNGETGGIQP